MSAIFSIFAYIDPGSGSFLVQLLVGGILAASLALKSFGGRIMAAFRAVLPHGTQVKDVRRRPED